MFYLRILILSFLLLPLAVKAEEATIYVKGQKSQILAEEVSERGNIEPGDAIRNIEGMHVIRRGKASQDFVLRGFQRDNINVLVEGEKVYGACPNRMDPPSSLLNLQDAGRIEVIKGPYDVKTQGGLGGTVNFESRPVAKGLENYLKLQTGSFNDNLMHYRASYGGEGFYVSVSGSYNSYHPYLVKDKKSLTGIYPDVDQPLYILSVADPVAFAQLQRNIIGPFDIGSGRVLGTVLRHEYPYLFPENFPAPFTPLLSPNRYEYNQRNVLGIRRAAELQAGFEPVKNHEIEIKANYQSRDNDVTPYLLMDMIWDDYKRISVAYRQKNVSDFVRNITYQIYGNEVLHDMTDELRCSSHVPVPGSGDVTGCVTNTLSRKYGMKSWATSGMRGAKVETTLKLMGQTTIGVDTYLRKWNVETTMRMPYPAHLVNEYPAPLPPINYAALSNLLNGPAGATIESIGLTGQPVAQPMAPSLFYRTQASIPDTEARNTGIYFENKEEISNKLTQNYGIRYDVHNVKAKKDRRILYNIYYPGYKPFVYYKYIVANNEFPDLNQTFTTFDAEVYLPSGELKRSFAETSGFIRWEYIVDPSLKTKFGIGYGVRFPDPQELYFAIMRMGRVTAPDFVGNPTLKPTRNRQFDAGIETKASALRFDVDVFYSTLDNYTVVRNSPDHLLGSLTRQNPLYYLPLDNGFAFYQYVNHAVTYASGVQRTNINPDPAINSPLEMWAFGRWGRTFKQVDAVMYGGEMRLGYSLTDTVILKGGLSYTRGINTTEKTNLPEMPPLKGKVAVEYSDGTLSTELEGVFADQQKLVDTLIGERRTPGWGIANWRISYILSSSKDNVTKINAGINNIFNRYYFEHLSYLRDPYASGIRIPEPGRNFYANVEIKF